MTGQPAYEFVSAAACRDPKVDNCMEVATNIPGVVALRESAVPGVVIETTPERWATFVEAVRTGEYDLSA
ncbi:MULTISPECIES: DUF397 domain-containing protein [Streptomyces]|uniref:DUF397 domain-containing protein n=1 Tax=Streptomyces noboritoensis TaxID=67337 RepID=A0ABV6TMW1_9ACTN|nr:DUF397 domain-containing protein [Streptomyces melanogenes]GGP68861.1 hypothetical protein GCM10010278_52820 [Streptomyces melanogenes]